MAGRGRGRGRGDQLRGATWAFDETMTLDTKPLELFPPHPNIRKPAPITPSERLAINSLKTLQDQIHRGPLYTKPSKRNPNNPTKTFGEEQLNRQYGTNNKADIDPFLGVETYSQRYAPKRRDLPVLSERSFDKSLFPKELWSTLDGTDGVEVREKIQEAMVRKAGFVNGNGSGETESKRRVETVLEKIDNLAGGGDEDVDDEGVEEEQDDEFDDEDMGGDYNAEGYFEAGDKDDDDEENGGGDD